MPWCAAKPQASKRDIARMPLQNRVTPFGEIIAVEARGTLMGNRGCLHDDQKRLGPKVWKRVAWITCALEYQNIRRPLMQPGQYTELFFLDEATALAAGHRPCGECRKDALRHFKDCWAKGNNWTGSRLGVADLDAALQAERIDEQGRKRLYEAPLCGLPDGAFVALEGDALMKLGDVLLPWSPFGYGPGVHVEKTEALQVLTPHSIVNAIFAGYVPKIHQSAVPSSEAAMINHDTLSWRQ